MSSRDIELIKFETRRLEALGYVLGMLGPTLDIDHRQSRPLHPHPPEKIPDDNEIGL